MRPGSSPPLVSARQPRTGPRPTCSTWPRRGPTCTRRSRSTRPRRSPPVGASTRSPSPGSGCPAVAEFCVAELGAVLGVSTTAAKRLMGHALELRHRLPRLWSQVQSGRVPAWRARLVAEATIHATPTLTPEAAGWVDTQVAAVAGKVGPAQLDRLVAEAIKRFELVEEEPFDPDGWQKVDPRHVTIDRDEAHFAGTLHLEAEIDIADALDLDRALAQGAATRAALGSTLSLGARRAMALGDLARTQTALDLAEARGTDDTDHLPGCPGGRAARPLHRHHRRPGHGVRADRTPRGGSAAGAARPGQGLVHRLTDQGDHQAGHRPHHRPLGTGVRGHGPAPRARRFSATGRACSRGAADRHARAMWTTSSPTTTTPPPRVDPNPVPRPPRTWPRCAGTTTGSRPTPPGATPSSGRASSSGPAPTATASTATRPAPPRSSHRTEDDPAPHPATPPMAGPQARSGSEGSFSPDIPPSARCWRCDPSSPRRTPGSRRRRGRASRSARSCWVRDR